MSPTAPPISRAPAVDRRPATPPTLWRRLLGCPAQPSRTAVALLLALLALLVYANTFDAGYTLDNRIIIHDDPRLTANTPAELRQNLLDIFTRNYWWPRWESDLYRPLTTLSYLVNFALVGNDRSRVASLHAVNLALHFANALLVFAVTRRVLRRTWPAVFIAAVFTVHPLATETVTNLVGRADLFATLAVLLGFYLHIRRTQEPLRKTFDRAAVLPAMAAVSILGVFCKESAVVLLGVIGLYDACFALGADAHARPRLLHWRAAWDHFRRIAWPSYLAIVPSVVLLFGVRYWLLHDSPVFTQTGCDNPLAATDALTGRITALGTIGDYLRLMLLPATLSCDYSYDQIPVFSWALTRARDLYTLSVIAGLAVLSFVVLRHGRRNRQLLFFAGLFTGVFLPTSNLLMVVGTIMGERFMYLPLVGFVGALMVTIVPRVVGRLGARLGDPRRTAIVVTLIASGIVAALGARAFARNFHWRDSLTLWTAAVEACPNSHKVYAGLANALYERDPENVDLARMLELLGQARRVIEANPLPPAHMPGKVYNDYAEIAMKLGDRHAHAAGTPTPPLAAVSAYEKGHEAVLRAVAIDTVVNNQSRQSRLARGTPAGQIPDVGNYHVHITRGNLAMRLGRLDEAAAAFAYARRLEPARVETHISEAIFRQHVGQHEHAAVLILQALLLDSNRPEYWRALADTYRLINPAVPAVTLTGQQPTLNTQHPLVPQHLAVAFRSLVGLLADARRWDDARYLRDLAVNKYHQSPAALDPFFAAQPR